MSQISLEKALVLEKYRKLLESQFQTTQNINIRTDFKQVSLNLMWEQYENAFDERSLPYIRVPVNITISDTLKDKNFAFTAKYSSLKLLKRNLTPTDIMEHITDTILRPFSYRKSSSTKAYYFCACCDNPRERHADNYCWPNLSELNSILAHHAALLSMGSYQFDEEHTVRHILGHLATLLSHRIAIGKEIPHHTYCLLVNFLSMVNKEHTSECLIVANDEFCIHTYNAHGVGSGGISSFAVQVNNGKPYRTNVSNFGIIKTHH